MVEDYLVNVMGATLVTDSSASTIFTYQLTDDLSVSLRYHHTVRLDQDIHLGSLTWQKDGEPAKLELLSGMSDEDICKYIVHRTLQLTL